jgi:hypothetical protein
MEHIVYDLDDVDAGRAYVQAELGFVLFSHAIYVSITGNGGHEVEGAGAGGHKH